MTNYLLQLKKFFGSLATEEDGAQIVEYALIIAVVSIGLMLLLQVLTTQGGAFDAWIGRVVGCLQNSVCV